MFPQLRYSKFLEQFTIHNILVPSLQGHASDLHPRPNKSVHAILLLSDRSQ
jgi:hypothetical protein